MEHDFLVLNKTMSNFSFILGLDFILKHHVNILGRGSNVLPVIQMYGKDWRLVGVGESLGIRVVAQKEKEIKCHLEEDSVLMPSCISFLELLCQGGNNGDLVLVKGCREHDEIIIESVGAIREDRLIIGVMNMSPVKIKLPRGQICTAEEIEIVGQAAEGKIDGNLGIAQSALGVNRLELLRRHVNKYNHDLEGRAKYILDNLVEKYSDVFTIGDEAPGRLKEYPFRIRLKPGEEPVQSRPYKIPFCKEEIVQKEIDKLLQEGIISPSSSPWSSLIVLVRKNDGSARMCVDVRRLNSK